MPVNRLIVLNFTVREASLPDAKSEPLTSVRIGQLKKSFYRLIAASYGWFLILEHSGQAVAHLPRTVGWTDTLDR